MIKAFFFSLYVSSLSFASSTFVASDYVHIRQEGRVHVRCDDGMDYTYTSFWCQGSYMTPEEQVYFRTTLRKGIHHVRMTFTNDQHTKSDTWRLNGISGKSFFKISLIGSAGVLVPGKNKIQYSVEERNNQILEEGTFETMMTEPPIRQCRPIYVRSVEMMDCRSKAFACRQMNYPHSNCEPLTQ